jgi:hypothetical protein
MLTGGTQARRERFYDPVRDLPSCRRSHRCSRVAPNSPIMRGAADRAGEGQPGKIFIIGGGSVYSCWRIENAAGSRCHSPTGDRAGSPVTGGRRHDRYRDLGDPAHRNGSPGARRVSSPERYPSMPDVRPWRKLCRHGDVGSVGGAANAARSSIAQQRDQARLELPDITMAGGTCWLPRSRLRS